MAEDWEGIRDEVSQALGEIELQVLLHKKTERESPWEWAGDYGTPTPLRAVNLGVKTLMSSTKDGELVPRQSIVLMVEAGSVVPLPGDAITLNGSVHVIKMAKPVQPSAIAVAYKLELEITASRSLA